MPEGGASLPAGLRGCQRIDPLEKLFEANSNLFAFPPKCNDRLLVCLNRFDSFPGFRSELFESLLQSAPLPLGLLEKLAGLQDFLLEFLQLIFCVAQEAPSFQNCRRWFCRGTACRPLTSCPWFIGRGGQALPLHYPQPRKRTPNGSNAAMSL